MGSWRRAGPRLASHSERGDLCAGPLALLASSPPRLLATRLDYHRDLDGEADRRGDRLAEGGHEARRDAVARDGIRGAEEQGLPISPN
jgi:hypothetical protein